MSTHHNFKVVGFGDPVLDVIIPDTDYATLDNHKLERGGSHSIELDELDRLLSIPELPPHEHQIRLPGGSAANVCKCLSQLSRHSIINQSHSNNNSTTNNKNSNSGRRHRPIDVSFVGMVGTDSTGKEYSTMLQKHGVRPLLLENQSNNNKPGAQSTAQCLCFITPDGQRTMRTFLGAALELKHIPSEYIVPTTTTIIEKSTIDDDNDDDDYREVMVHLAHFEGYCMYKIEMAQRTMKEAKERGNAVVSLDLASYEIVSGCWDALCGTLKHGLVDIVFCNEDEAVAVAKRVNNNDGSDNDGDTAAATNIDDCIDTAVQFLLQYCTIVVVSRGKDGCLAASKTGQRVHAHAEQGIHVIDTVGAGDFFSAGFLYGWLHGLPLDKCAECGCAAGATVVQVVGAEVNEEKMMQLYSRIQAIFDSVNE